MTANVATATQVAELFAIDGAQIVSVQSGQVIRVANGKLSVLSAAVTSHQRMLFLLCDNFSYPLVEQPVMKSDDRLYLLPAQDGKTFVVSIDGAVSASTVAEFEEVLAECTNFRRRDNHALVIDRQTATPPAQGQAIVPTATNGVAAGAITSSARPIGTAGISVSDVGSGISTGVLLAGKVAAGALVIGADYAGRGVKWSVPQRLSRLIRFANHAIRSVSL